MRQVTSSLLASGVRRSDQQAVWSVVAEKSSRLGAASETAAMSAMYDNVDHSLDDFVAAFPPVDRQVGAVFVVDGRLAGLELFDASSIWRKLSPKLVRSYALDAIDFQKGAGAPVASTMGRTLVEAVRSSNGSVFPALGEGEDVRLSGGDVIGAALVARGRAIHVTAFSVSAA
jgi:hypothetical protein